MTNSDSGGIILTSNNIGEKAKPYSIEKVPDKINKYLSELKNYGDELEVDTAPTFTEIALLSRQAGTEFASITVNRKHYIIKGDERGTMISKSRLEDIKKHKGILNCHSHPYISDLLPSESDMEVAEMLYWQKDFYIITPDYKKAIYTKEGRINIDTIKEVFSTDQINIFEELFGGDFIDK